METAESRALHSDVKLNKAGVMFSFISPVIALTVSVMVPGKVRIFWETIWICWEFWLQSPLLSALHRGENNFLTQKCKTWMLWKSICRCCYCLSQAIETHLSEGAVGYCSVADSTRWCHGACLWLYSLKVYSQWWMAKKCKSKSRLRRHFASWSAPYSWDPQSTL